MELDGWPHAYIAFDLETTGLFARIDRVVEIAAVRFGEGGEELGRFERLVHPGRRMSPAAQAVHCISDDDLADAPPAREVLPDFLAFLGDEGSCSLIAHNASFDAGFLGAELRRAGLELPLHRVFDTLALARRRRPDLPRHRLEDLSRAYGIARARAHRALDDALCVKDLWVHLRGHADPDGVLVSYPIHCADEAQAAPHGWDLLSYAMESRAVIHIEYDGGTKGRGPRRITPRRFIHKGGEAYVLALCQKDGFEKAFRLDRIVRCELVAEPAVPVVDGRSIGR
ncbi:DNA polymerase III PolC-type [Aquisphaera giovannonii]|uniref:DNA polymerase III PolC-type n=1 Tax=Aquisphaera giovannonii TaxID=406548 RepID=A0A5B9W062_9BACT|nr:exonuclease domain-containing protein [Aquisphaera giovannonii]QEH33938.1 DNA polymerase III PolC-type [Aquisphaera giovannonii]